MSNFYNTLVDHIRSNETDYANSTIMKELGRILAEQRGDFVMLLKSCGLPANDKNTDAELIDMFLENLPTNRNLLVGASLLVSHHNKTVGFDGEPEMSDAGIKAMHKIMLNHFNGGYGTIYSSADGEEGSGPKLGGGWAGAIKSIVDTGGKIGGNIMQNQRNTKYGAQDLLLKKQNAKIEMAQSAMAQRKLQQEALIKQKAESQKTRRTLLIGGGILLGLIIIGGTIYYVRKNK